MFGFLGRLLDTKTLSPHGFCLLWRPELLWTHVGSDALIGLAYMTIPVSLAVLLHRRKDIPFGGVVWCFALFITACGMTHFMSIWTLWHPDYGAEALVKLFTAIVSVITAVLMWRLIPLALTVPSPAHLRQVNRELELRIAERDLAIAELQTQTEERIRAEAVLLQTQKLEALGQLTGGVAHDFNNLLQAVQGAFEMIGRRAGDGVKVQQLAEDGLKATQRGARLSAQLLTFSRSKQLKPEVFEVDELVSGLRDMLGRTLGSTIDLRFELFADGECVSADRTQLELALINLAINARDAIDTDGRIVIQTGVIVLNRAEPDLDKGTYVRIAVSDNGSGMSPEVVAKAFDPFFTTKAIGKGTGLGLSQVYGFAKQVGGAARIESREGAGATVSILLPRGERPRAAPAPSRESGATAAARTGRILVVDDDPAVRRSAVEVLRALGHQVVETADGAAALAAIERETPDVMLVDYAMPGLSGAQLASEVRARHPAMPILFVTGYADVDGVRSVLGADQVILRKPYRFEELRQHLAEALEGTPRTASTPG